MTLLDDPPAEGTPEGEAPLHAYPEPEGAAPEGTGLLRAAMDWRSLARTPHGLLPVLILAFQAFFTSLSGRTFGLALPDILRDLHIRIDTITRYTAFIASLGSIFAIGVAYLADRVPRLPMFAGGMVVTGFINAFVARAKSAVGIAVPNTTSDMTLLLAEAPTVSLLADYYPPESRGRAFAFWQFFRLAGALGTPLIVAALITAFGWRASYVVVSVPMVIVGVVGFLVLREPVRGYMERRALGLDEAVSTVEEEPPSFGEAWRTIWAVRTLRRMFIASIFSLASSVLFSLYSALLYASKYGLSVNQRALMATFFGVVALVGTFLGGGLVDTFMKWRPSSVLMVLGGFSVVSAFAILLYAFGLPLWLIIPIGALQAFVATLLGPAFLVVYVQVLPANVRTLGSAVQGLASLPGALIFFPIAGAIAVAHGLQAAMLFVAPLDLLGALILFTTAPLFEFDMRSAFAANAAGEEWRRSKRDGQGKLLVSRGVEVEYDGVQVLFGVDFDVDEGDIIALLGTNGAGKSTLLRAISGTQEASAGAVIFDGRDTTHMPPHEIANRGVIHMPGGRGTFPGLTVRENLLMGTWMSEPSEAAERLPEVLAMFPVLSDRSEELAGALSGGEQQMLSLAQAFLAKPRLLMIDELSLGLSPAVVGELIEAVRRIHAQGATIIIVEQSVNVALSIADRAIFMEKGEVKFVGKTADLLDRPDILRAVYVKGTASVSDRAPARRGLGEPLTILEVAGVSKSFGGIRALDDVSFTLAEGRTLGIIGPNGSGKTTLFDIISGYQTADAGTLHYDGVDIGDLTPEERARRKLVRRFQDARLFPSLTVFETLLVSLDQRVEVKSIFLTSANVAGARRSERRLRAQAERLIELLDLGAYRDKFVRELSTGLRRIVDVACVLATEPRVLLLDEPSSGIAQAEAENLGPLLRRVVFETGCSVLIIEHDMPLISSVSDELLALERGTVLLRGEPNDVLNDDRVASSYLGDSDAAIKRSGR
jgi:ABC-type branched-subunit amino acid transport system ATPase component/predicted MFS family arabinose efflux permease